MALLPENNTLKTKVKNGAVVYIHFVKYFRCGYSISTAVESIS